MAADACPSPAGRLCITDRVGKLWFLVDTGSDLCVFPWKLVPGPKKRTGYDLFPANGTLIPTFGWRNLTMNIGHRRDFTWRFMVTDVQLPIIRVDMLANIHLLVNCRNYRILDGITSLSTPAQAAFAQFPSVKTIDSTTPVDELCTELPDLTRPTETPRVVCHITVTTS
jgi:hypothetical protein